MKRFEYKVSSQKLSP